MIINRYPIPIDLIPWKEIWFSRCQVHSVPAFVRSHHAFVKRHFSRALWPSARRSSLHTQSQDPGGMVEGTRSNSTEINMPSHTNVTLSDVEVECVISHPLGYAKVPCAATTSDASSFSNRGLHFFHSCFSCTIPWQNGASVTNNPCRN